MKRLALITSNPMGMMKFCIDAENKREISFPMHCQHEAELIAQNVANDLRKPVVVIPAYFPLLEMILLSNPINDDILPLIEKEIRTNYVKKEWKKFDYISVSVPPLVYAIYFVVIIVSQIGIYVWFHNDEVFD